MLKFSRYSLRFKLVIITIMVEVVMLSLLVINNFRLNQEIIVEQTEKRIATINPLLNASLNNPLFQRDYEVLEQTLDLLITAENSDFEYIAIFDLQGNMLSFSGEKYHRTHFPEPNLKISDSLDERHYYAEIPISISHLKIGKIKYGLSIGAFIDGRERILHQSILIAAIEIFLSTILLGFIGYFLTRHLGHLIDSTGLMRQGNYDINIDIKSKDEIGILSREFNLMASAVRKHIGDLKHSEKALAKSQAQFESVFYSLHDVILFINTDHHCMMINPSVITTFGYETEELLGERIDFIFADKKDYETFIRKIEGFNQIFNDEINFVRQDRNVFPGEITTSPVTDKTGDFLGHVSIIRDITKRKTIENELNKEKELAQVTLESIADAVITTNEHGKIDYMNPVAEQLLAWDRNDANDHIISDIFRLNHDITGEALANPVMLCLKEKRIIESSLNTRLINQNGEEYLIEESSAPIRSRNNNILGAVLTFHDVTESRKMANELNWQASHDSLTGLINRNEFEAQLNKSIQNISEQHSMHCLFNMDLAQFKVVNDSCGHLAGDELLKQLSERFQHVIRDSDTLARIGGDEFGVLLTNCPLIQAEKIAQNLLKLMEEYRFKWNDNSFVLGLSIGIVPINSHADTVSSLMGNADLACYAAKDGGRNRIHIYQADDSELVKRKGEIFWASQVELALEQNNFLLYAQQIVPIRKDIYEKVHFEVLIRMKDNEGKLVPPIAFLPAAEHYNLMPKVDRWVIDEVFNCLLNNAHQDCMISINLSGQSIGDEKFLAHIINKLQTLNIPKNSICFEITETAAIANYSRALNFITSLKKFGCSFSLDDFGSGLSSFGYLKSFPVDYLKIDGSFVKDMIEDPIDDAMVNAINQIGQVMNIKTIAEFVENDEILARLADIGINYAQGYGIARPVPISEAIYSLINNSDDKQLP